MKALGYIQKRASEPGERAGRAALWGAAEESRFVQGKRRLRPQCSVQLPKEWKWRGRC